MFGRLRRWLRGRKKNVSISKPTKEKGFKRDTLRKSRSLHDIVLTRENEDFGFKRNDLNDFDLVPSGELQREHNNNISASTVSLVSPSLNITPPMNNVTHHKRNPQENAVEKTSHENKFISETADSQINDSLDGSVVDLVTSSSIEPELTSQHEQDLSLDEMQVMDMFDSMVHDIEVEDNNVNSEIVSLKVDASNCIANDNESVQDEIVSAQQKIASQSKSPVDFAQVFGKDLGENGDVGKVDNWRISRVESVHKSIKFVDSNIYLPTRPKLPPTDYPDTDNELRQADEINADATGEVQAPQESSLTSPPDSSVTSPRSSSQSANGKVDNGKMPNSLLDESALDTSDAKIHSNTLPKASYTNGSPQFSTAVNNQPNGKPYSSTVSAMPKKPKPRVTSFKKAEKVPQLKNAQNFTELVEKFEKF